MRRRPIMPAKFVLIVTYTIWTLFCAVFGSTIASTQEHPSPKINLELSLDKAKFSVGEPIRLKLEISNVGRVPFLIGNDVPLDADPNSHLELELRDESGHVSPQIGFNADSFGTRQVR